ncbi:uncharacterized protein LOC144208070 [Stigmatopora nigra]
MSGHISLHSKLSSILKTLAESAMAELSNAVDEDTVELRLELTRLQTLNLALKEKVDTLECELTVARNDVPPVPRSHRTVAIQTGDDHDIHESKSPVIEGVFGKDWCLNLWNDRSHTSDRMDDQSLDKGMDVPVDLHALSQSSTPELEKGAEFCSFESFKEAIENWQRSNFVELYNRSSGTVENAKKRTRKKSFTELHFACAHVSKGSDIKCCPFTIKVRVTPDGRKLYIKDISPANCHNHEVSQAFLSPHDSEHVDGIQVKKEDYPDGMAANLAHKTLKQKKGARVGLVLHYHPQRTPFKRFIDYYCFEISLAETATLTHFSFQQVTTDSSQRNQNRRPRGQWTSPPTATKKGLSITSRGPRRRPMTSEPVPAPPDRNTHVRAAT